MNIFFLFFIFIIFFFPSTVPPISGSKYKYEVCYVNNPMCGNVENLLQYVSKCIGLVMCYQSFISNPDVFDNIKFHHEHEVPKGNDPRLCEHCIKTGQCKEYVDGKRLEWNGFKLYFYHSTKTLELENDFYGNRFYQNFTDLTPLEFLNLVANGGNEFKQFNERFENNALNTVYFDLLFYFERYDPLKNEGRRAFLGLHGTQECEEEEPINENKPTDFVSKIVNPNCTHYTTPSYYDKFSCHCGHPKNEFYELNKCCKEHRVCIKEIKKNCPINSNDYYYIPMNMTKYNYEIYRKFDNAFHCMDLENNKCQEAMCNCDRKVAECWTALSNVPNVTICLSCYMDDARQFANEPIKSLLAVRNLLNEQIDKTDQMIMRGGNNDELILRMELAIISLKKSHKLIDKIDLQFSKLFNDTQDKAKEYVKTAEELHSQKRTTEAEKYSQFAIYKNNVINLALGEYLKDRKLTFDIIEKLHLYIHNLEKLLRF